MNSQRFLPALLLLAVAAMVAPAQGASMALGDSGWTASWNSSLDPFLSIGVDLSSSTADNVVIEKVVRFDGSFSSAAVTFQQTSPTAKNLIIISDETVTNDSGSAWTGFKMSLTDGNTGTDGATTFTVHFDTGVSGNFRVTPFTSSVFSDSNQTLTVSGGTVPSSPAPDNVWRPGQGVGGGQLAIAAMPVTGGASPRSFMLVEQPNPGGPPPVIPIPAAAWTGLSGLLGLGLISSAKHVRRLFN